MLGQEHHVSDVIRTRLETVNERMIKAMIKAMMERQSLETISLTMLFIWLVVLSIEDIKHKKISLIIILIGGLCLFTFSLAMSELSIRDRIGGIMIGGFMLLISYLTRGQIGLGDGLVLSIIGISYGFLMNLNLLILGLILSSIFSILLLICKKAKKKSTIPFIPFLLAGYLGVLIL